MNGSIAEFRNDIDFTATDQSNYDKMAYRNSTVKTIILREIAVSTFTAHHVQLDHQMQL